MPSRDGRRVGEAGDWIGFGRDRYGGAFRFAAARIEPLNGAAAWARKVAEGLAGFGVDFEDAAIVGGIEPKEFAVKGESAAAIAFGVELADYFAVGGADEVGAIVLLIEDPQAFGGGLHSVRARAGRVENLLDFDGSRGCVCGRAGEEGG